MQDVSAHGIRGLYHVLILLSDDMQKRYSVFYLIGSFASALAGILAYGVSCFPKL